MPAATWDVIATAWALAARQWEAHQVEAQQGRDGMWRARVNPCGGVHVRAIEVHGASQDVTWSLGGTPLPSALVVGDASLPVPLPLTEFAVLTAYSPAPFSVACVTTPITPADVAAADALVAADYRVAWARDGHGVELQAHDVHSVWHYA